MNISAVSAKALATIILIGTQGIDNLKLQLPLEVEERGEGWFVKGTPYTDKKENLQYCFFHIFKKKHGEITEIGYEGRMILNEDEKKNWSKKMTKVEYQRIFGLRTNFEEGGNELARNLAMNSALYGGLVNKREDAVDYAYILLQSKPELAAIPKSTLEAEEKSKIWHITAKLPGRPDRDEVLSFSRINGKVL